jgi:hypothetical protein
MHANLPVWLRGNCTTDNKLSLQFANGSQIKAVASSKDAGRSEALSLLILDECVGENTNITVRNKITGDVQTLAIGEFYKSL